MLHTVRVFSSWASAVEVPLDPLGGAETDPFQIRNIEGLGPVNASVNTSPIASSHGDRYVGSSVGARNIVLTVKPNPNWQDTTYESLRKLLYSYFMPGYKVRLVFESDEFSPVEIFGYVETNEPAIFSKDGEINISVICPYPYFVSVDPVVIDGVNNDPEIDIDYQGTIETGIQVQISWASGLIEPLSVVQVGDPLLSTFRVWTNITEDQYFAMSSIPGSKYVRHVGVETGLIENLLNDILPDSEWPVLQPGTNKFAVYGSLYGVQNWRLVYYNRYGGL